MVSTKGKEGKRNSGVDEPNYKTEHKESEVFAYFDPLNA